MENNNEKIIDIKTLQESAQLDDYAYYDRRGRRRQMHKVIPQISRKKHHIERVYEPEIVSLGPYHHGSVELGKSEEFKAHCVRWLAGGSEEKEKVLSLKIMERIDDVRNSYAEASVLSQYDDEKFGRMMLKDACFIVNYMANETRMARNNLLEWTTNLGLASFPFILRDIMKLENQVPFFVIKLLIGLQEGEEWEELLHRFLGWLLLRDGSHEQVRIPRIHEDPPLHLLEAVWRAIAQGEDEPIKPKIPTSLQFGSKIWQKLPKVLSMKRKDEDVLYHSQRMFRSVMDLKAKGIYFGPSSSYSLKDVRFKSFSYYGQLQLPIRYVSDQHQVILLNLIAYELSPDTNEDYTVLSYTILMKSLIESPEDVKELQKRGILFNKYSNHEQVVKAFEDIDTYGIVHLDVFSDIKEKIGEHCRNRAKTWTADLIHTRLQSPWSIMAVCAATSLLCLTTLQTFYSIHHPN